MRALKRKERKTSQRESKARCFKKNGTALLHRSKLRLGRKETIRLVIRTSQGNQKG